MYCRNCGKEIDDKAEICIYCGVSTKKQEETEKKKVNAFGLAGFIVSLLSLWLGVYFCIASIIGLVLSIVGMTQTKKCSVNGFAIAGLVLGIISLVIWGIVWLAVGAVISTII